MIDNDTTFLCCSIIGLALVSLLVWKFLLSPSTPRTSAATTTSTSGARAASNSSTSATQTATRSASSNRAASSSHFTTAKDSEDDTFSFGQPRHPTHLLAPSNWTTQNKVDLSTCLLKGIVPFRSTPASGYEVRLQQQQQQKAQQQQGGKDLVVINRKERARIFARMFSPKAKAAAAAAAAANARPPNRGANIVVTIQHTDVSCSKLQKALFLLGTYYNLFLLIDTTESVGTRDEEIQEYTKKIRSQLLNIHATDDDEGENNDKNDGEDDDNDQYELNASILPQHRIAFSSTSKGRVAFVRQLHGTELVVDFDSEVAKELERFGFRALVYPSKTNEGVNTSGLGDFLIP